MKLFKAIALTGLMSMMTLGMAAKAGQQGDLVDTAVSVGKFNTLVALVKEAELVDALKGDGPLTVFAPNDEAFAKVPKAAVDALMADKDLLKEVLLYHVVAGNVMAKDLRRGHVEMLNGANANVKLGHKGEAKINQAVVLLTDVKATNGVIHVINDVILPPKVIQALKDKGIL